MSGAKPSFHIFYIVYIYGSESLCLCKSMLEWIVSGVRFGGLYQGSVTGFVSGSVVCLYGGLCSEVFFAVVQTATL